MAFKILKNWSIVGLFIIIFTYTCAYKHSILLYTHYDIQTPKLNWIALNFNQNSNSINSYFSSFSTNNAKIGKNKNFRKTKKF